MANEMTASTGKTAPAEAPRGKRAALDARRPRGTGASFVYDRLKAKILNLELKPGTLLDETELSREFKLSRSPVREALIRLSAEGLVDTPRNRTSMVAQFDFTTLPAYFDSMQLLYRVSARLAALNAPPGAVEALRRIQAELDKAHARRSPLDVVRFNRAFHAEIAAMGGNPFVTGWMKGLLDQGQRVMRLYMQRFHDRVPTTKLDQHRALIAAIEAGDADAAERAGMADAGNLIEEVTSFFSDLPTAELAIDTGTRRRKKQPAPPT